MQQAIQPETGRIPRPLLRASRPQINAPSQPPFSPAGVRGNGEAPQAHCPHEGSSTPICRCRRSRFRPLGYGARARPRSCFTARGFGDPSCPVCPRVSATDGSLGLGGSEALAPRRARSMSTCSCAVRLTMAALPPSCSAGRRDTDLWSIPPASVLLTSLARRPPASVARNRDARSRHA
jgi:hypothetical protein